MRERSSGLAQSVGWNIPDVNNVVSHKGLDCGSRHELIGAPENEAMLGATDCDVSLIAPYDSIQGERSDVRHDDHVKFKSLGFSYFRKMNCEAPREIVAPGH